MSGLIEGFCFRSIQAVRCAGGHRRFSQAEPILARNYDDRKTQPDRDQFAQDLKSTQTGQVQAQEKATRVR
jgi:hypothetical protein